MLARGVLLVVLALGLTGLFELSGLTPLADHAIHDRWFASDAIGSSRSSVQRVVLIEGDADTVAAWGPPPWPPERLAALAAAVDAGGPLLMVEVGHERMFRGGEDLDAAVEPWAGALLLQAQVDWVSPWSEGGLRLGALPASEEGRLAQVIARANFGSLGEELPVQWLVPDSRLQRVPAHRAVNTENIPSDTYTQRLVLFGITDSEHALRIETPIGPMSTAEVEAHAITGMADGAVARRVSPLWVYTGCGLLALVVVWGLERLGGLGSLALIAVFGAAVVGLDLALLNAGWGRLGASRPLMIIMFVALGYWVAQVIVALSGLRQLRVRVLKQATAERGAGPDEGDEGFWDDLAALGAEYGEEVVAGAAAATIIEREPERWQLDIKASAKLDPESHSYLLERGHLDLRRAPFRAVWMTLRANWADDLLPPGDRLGQRRTLLIPLEDEGELLGLWLIHVPVEAEVERDAVETFERLGRQMAAAIVRRRERSVLRDQGGRWRMRDHLGSIVAGLRLLNDEHRWALELLEQLPVRAIIATVWGEIEFVDPRLQLTLSRRYPGLFGEADTKDIRGVVARLTGKSLDEVHRLMRKVVSDGVEVELDSIPGDDGTGEDIWVMSRIRSKRGIELPGFKPAVHEHILLMARSAAPPTTVRTRSGNFLKVLSGKFGGQ